MTCLKVISAALVLTFTVSNAHAQTTVTTNFSAVNKVIPDGQRAGVSDTHVIHFDNPSFINLTDLQVNISISGGYNGDIYGYLVHDSGFSVLFNRAGRSSTNSPGYSDTGFNVTLADGANDLHFYKNSPFTLNGNGQLTGTWSPDGRYADPAVVSEATSPSSLLGSFNGTNPNGSWTLFLADVDFGQQSTLVQWGLVVSAVPEPTGFGLVGVGALILGATLYRRRK